jgi:hypothetical protein
MEIRRTLATMPLCGRHFGSREQYLPDGEIRNLGVDKQGCVTRAYINDLATKLTAADQTGKMSPENRAWGRAMDYANAQGRWDYSEAFIEIVTMRCFLVGGSPSSYGMHTSPSATRIWAPLGGGVPKWVYRYVITIQTQVWIPSLRRS